MALTLSSLKISGVDINFSPGVKNYQATTNLSSVEISADTLESGVAIGIAYKQKNSTVTGERTISQTYNLSLGVNNFTIRLNKFENNKSITTAYYIVLNYAQSASQDPVWPISSDEFPPGFYGGSYIPTYRYIKPIYSTSNKDWDFEKSYGSFSSSNEDAIQWMNSVIKTLTDSGQADALVESFIHYTGFINNYDGTGTDWRYVLPIIQVKLPRPSSFFGGYIPKNNKLYCYPFSSIELIGYGQNSELRYENFKDKNRLTFGIVGKFFAGASIQVYPIDYEGIEDNFNSGCTGDSLPIFPYTKDSYMNEYNAGQNARTQSQIALEQNRNLANLKTGISAVSSLVSGVTSIAGGSAVGSVSMIGRGASNVIEGTAGTAANIYGNNLTYHQGLAAIEAQLRDVANRPSTVSNQNASPSIPTVVKDGALPYISFNSIRKEYAEKIDEFFSKYGYKVTKFEEVNINTRPVFNFLKCSQARVDGSIPQEDLITIKGILEKGITFWHDPTKILDYSVDNPAPVK